MVGGPDKQIVSPGGNVVQSSLDLEVDALGGGEGGRGCQRWAGIRLTEQAGHIPGKQPHQAPLHLPRISVLTFPIFYLSLSPVGSAAVPQCRDVPVLLGFTVESEYLLPQ